jgi:hypothetical protein
MKPTGVKRGNRRAQLAKKKRKARKLFPHDQQATNANHLAHCSCHMCGNPRKHWRLRSLNELRQINVGDDEGKSLS